MPFRTFTDSVSVIRKLELCEDLTWASSPEPCGDKQDVLLLGLLFQFLTCVSAIGNHDCHVFRRLGVLNRFMEEIHIAAGVDIVLTRDPFTSTVSVMFAA